MPHFLGEIHIVQRASDNWKHEPPDAEGNRVLRIRPPKPNKKKLDYLSAEVNEPSEHEGLNYDEDQND